MYYAEISCRGASASHLKSWGGWREMGVATWQGECIVDKAVDQWRIQLRTWSHHFEHLL